jgi:type IV pilus assembly protein PilB
VIHDPQTLRLGERILEKLQADGVITAEQLELSRRRARRTFIPAHQAAIELGVCGEDPVFRAMAELLDIPFTSLANVDVPEDAVKLVTAKIAFHYNFVPLNLEKRLLTAAFSSPPTARSRENMRVLLGVRLNPRIASPSSIRRTLKKLYGLGADTVLQITENRLAEDRSAGGTTLAAPAAQELQQDLQSHDGETASITHLVNQLLLEAVELDATDIHIEPFPSETKVRYRIDGMLRDIPTPAALNDLHSAIVSRLKVMANLNIAEKRLPHDGRIRVNVGEDIFDLRVSVLPTRFGETLCLRILNRSAIFLEMSQLGLNFQHLNIFERLVQLPHGMILVTGPTGSGKTTTLYAALAGVRDSDRKIITVEDPVEYQLEGTSQIQVRSDIGLTFASGLRSILRHDPDIILVGEIRDLETAQIAIRSSLTGHLVLSTLHTNDSIGAVNRLVDMGVQPYLVAACMVAAIAQRLVRRVCRKCGTEDTMVSQEIVSEIADTLKCAEKEVKPMIGRGCSACNDSGYRGRVAIFELFLLDEHIQDLVARNVPAPELRAEAREKGMVNLRQNGWEKVMDGVTSVEEVTRITGNTQISY